MDHESKNTHHSGTTLVELNGTLLELLLLAEGGPAEIDGTIAKVTHKFSSGDVLHHEKLKETNEGNNLSKASSRNGVGSVDGGPAVGEGVEGVSSIVNVSGKVDSGTSDDVTKESKLGDTSVLDLDVTETVESLLVSIVKKAKRIKESERRLNTELILERSEGGGGLAGLGRCKGSSRGDSSGEDNRLHG